MYILLFISHQTFEYMYFLLFPIELLYLVDNVLALPTSTI